MLQTGMARFAMDISFDSTSSQDTWGGIFVFAMLILNMVEAAVAHLPKYHEPGYVRRGIGWNVETTETWYEVKDKRCSELPGDVKRKEDIIEYLTPPLVTFHGTGPHLIPSIVQQGFLKPEDIHPVSFETLPVVCGSTYGRGIYSSPDPHFALIYSGTQSLATTPNGIPGLKLIVCATIMGRTMEVSRDDNWRNQSEPYHGCDSDVANDNEEYIVFHNAQILPCHVLHLDWEEFNNVETFMLARMDVPKKRKPAPKNEVLSPGDMQRQKQERLAQAQKYFAYGFGPVSGRKIVIQEIGKIEDDEEYGQYQANRVDEAKSVDIWSDRYTEDYSE
ncbi:hypothetical protein C8J56DRAFT_891934 [Mycena floridula]|nr:hypothetical protein C8J56DRAFT_891934 [Mycena floridula]